MQEVTLPIDDQSNLLSKSTPIEIVYLPSEDALAESVEPIVSIQSLQSQNNVINNTNSNESNLDGNSSSSTINEKKEEKKTQKRLVRSKTFLNLHKGQTLTEEKTTKTTEEIKKEKESKTPLKIQLDKPLTPLPQYYSSSQKAKSATNSPKGRISINYIRRASTNYPISPIHSQTIPYC